MSAVKYEPKAIVQQLEQLFEAAHSGRFAMFEDIASQFNTPAWSPMWRKRDEDLAPAGENTAAWVDAGIVYFVISVLMKQSNYPDANNINSEDSVLKARSIVTMISVLRAFSWWIYTHKDTFDFDRDHYLGEFEKVFPVIWERCCLPFALSQTTIPATCQWVGTAPAELVMDQAKWYASEISGMEITFMRYGPAADIVLYTFLYSPPPFSSDITMGSGEEDEDYEREEHEGIIGSSLRQFLQMVLYDTYYFTIHNTTGAQRDLVQHLAKLRIWLSAADARRLLYAMEEEEDPCTPPAFLAEGILRLYNADPSLLEVISLDSWFSIWKRMLEQSEEDDPGSTSYKTNARSIYDVVSLIAYLINLSAEKPPPTSIRSVLHNTALGQNFSIIKLLSQTAMRVLHPIPIQRKDDQEIHPLPFILSSYSCMMNSIIVTAGTSDGPGTHLTQNEYAMKLKQEVESELRRYRAGTAMVPSDKPGMIEIRREFGEILESLYQKLGPL